MKWFNVLVLCLAITISSACAIRKTSVRASLAPHSVALTWADTQNPPGASYNIYRYQGKCWQNKYLYTNLGNVSATNYLDPTVISGKTYCFYVTAVINKLESGPSNKVRVNVP